MQRADDMLRMPRPSSMIACGVGRHWTADRCRIVVHKHPGVIGPRQRVVVAESGTITSGRVVAPHRTTGVFEREVLASKYQNGNWLRRQTGAGELHRHAL